MAQLSEGRAIRCDEALTRVFSLLGKRWTGVIIGVLLERPADREVRLGPPISSTYRLTKRGEALRSGLLALGTWAELYLIRPSRAKVGKPSA